VPANHDGLWPQLLSEVAGCACSAWRSADTMLRDAPGFGVAFEADFNQDLSGESTRLVDF
jgi:hypothetical protein